LINKLATKYRVSSTLTNHEKQLTNTITIYHKALERFFSLYLKPPLGIKDRNTREMMIGEKFMGGASSMPSLLHSYNNQAHHC